MDKVWYVHIDGQEEGPYSALDLKKDRRITPDTLVKKRGSLRWMAIRYVKELKEIFKDEAEDLKDQEEPQQVSLKKGKGELAIDLQKSSPPVFVWVLIAVLLLLYLFLKLYY